MAKKTPTNIAASVRTRLLNLARNSGKPFDVLLTRYVLERLLYRLSRSRHADRFVLKGAMLLTTWLPHTSRGTRDLDLLAFGESSEERILGIFRDIASIPADDGVMFDPGALRVGRIREELDYGGLRLRGTAELAGARVAIVIDVAFGDSVEPGLETIDYPPLLDQPPPKLRAYAPETVLAEKFQAMVALGRANSRMKDFYDVWALSKTFTFDSDRLARAVAATFARRSTAIPETSLDALTDAFAADPFKQRQWTAFAADIDDAPRDLQALIAEIAPFLTSVAEQARKL
ncbi:MAG: nucleotidyl transferase AbiEii/AbiGii toxin family protein [Alphaproteobacteria bacterium]|nr:nucleotidyl transferase AbiEii/AbiGii toxin family protein [Alphaproteobacteria bacterium]